MHADAVGEIAVLRSVRGVKAHADDAAVENIRLVNVFADRGYRPVSLTVAPEFCNLARCDFVRFREKLFHQHNIKCFLFFDSVIHCSTSVKCKFYGKSGKGFECGTVLCGRRRNAAKAHKCAREALRRVVAVF